MATKRELLDQLTKDQLRALATEFGLLSNATATKDELVETLAASHRLSIEAVQQLVPKILKTGDAADAVHASKQDFFSETAGSVFKQSDLLSASLAAAIASREAIQPGYITGILSQVDALRNARINQEDVPPHIWSQFSGKQRGAYKTAKNMSYQIPRFVETATRGALADDRVAEVTHWKNQKLPARVEYYVLQAHRAYVAEAYDACIVMIARAFEHLLKGLMQSKSIVYPPKSTLGNLVEVYKAKVGDDKVLEKVLEVANMDRVISAHDIPPFDKQMQPEDANHAWTAVDIVFRELLKH